MYFVLTCKIFKNGSRSMLRHYQLLPFTWFHWRKYITTNPLATAMQIAQAIFKKMVSSVSSNTSIAVFQTQQAYANNNTIQVLCNRGQLKEALQSLNAVEHPLDSFTYISLLQGCIKKKALSVGKLIHAHISESGFLVDRIVGNTLVNMYAKCGSLADARRVFDQMPARDVFSWTVIISVYARHGLAETALRLFYQMQRAGIQPDQFTFAAVLPACDNMEAIKDLHERITERGFQSDVFVGSVLVDMYAKCGSIDIARQVFDKMPQRDAISWNGMIAAYARHGLSEEALEVFSQMQPSNIEPNKFTFSIILPPCAKLGALQQGMEIHERIIRSGFQSDVFLMNALVDLYAKCGVVETARNLFDRMNQQDVVSWNAMITGYAQNGDFDRALKFFQAMQLTGVKRDSKTFALVISVCASQRTLEWGMAIHGHVIRIGYLSDVFVGSALLDMYAKCGNIGKARDLFDQMLERNSVSWATIIAGYAQNGHLEEALKLFQEMPERTIVAWNAMTAGYLQNGDVHEALKFFRKMPEQNLVSWNSMISGYTQNGHFIEALNLFQEMKQAGVRPNPKTIASVLAACAGLAALEQGMAVHEEISMTTFQHDIVVESALVDMYAKCGSIQKARDVFNNMKQRNVVSWTSMIAGYAMHGCSKEALELFEQMQCSGVYPNHITLLCVLSSCRHAGLVDEGRHYFACMRQCYHIMPVMEHYGCMVDLLGRAGHLDEAQDFIKNMPIKADASVWMSLLGACRIHNNTVLGERVAEHIFELDPEDTTPYVLLSNIYAAAGRWDDIQKVRKRMKDRQAKKMPGCSWIEVNKHVHIFLVGDRLHPKTLKTYAQLERLSSEMEASGYHLERLSSEMEASGYVPETRFVLNDEEEQKEQNLCHHSEKLAIAF